MSNYPLSSTDPLGTDLRLGADGDLTLTMSGSLDVATAQDNAAQAVRINLTTNPGNYLWGNDVGSNLAEYVDAPITTALLSTVQSTVRSLVESDPRIASVEDIAIDTSNPDTMIITVLATTISGDQASLTISTAGAAYLPTNGGQVDTTNLSVTWQWVSLANSTWNNV